ncbi:MAG: enoyl-CoA hydratase/isomerase family protein [Dehalococcoidales bacterium]|nr:enoyl-CoA hydratase/isomerase family protein [Dehalococcoidales bacterium]
MPIDYRKENRIAIITINNPDVYNALSPELLIELSDALIEYRDDPQLRACIITGAGEKAFCTGMDLKSVQPDGKGNPDARPENTLVRGLELWKPLIAAVNGYALGGGFEVALACDIRIASENASFGFPEVTLGIIPGWGGTQRLTRLIPFGIASEMILTGKRISALEALELNMVNKVVPQENLMTEALKLAGQLCDSGPLALQAAKEVMYRGYELPLDEGLALESIHSAKTMASRDFKEGRAAFLEKRTPDYTGE